jgi:release factor glutamine methyltransferase
VLLVETSDRQAPDMTEAMAAAGLSPAIHTDQDWGATVVTGRAADR